MHTATGQVVELRLQNGQREARISCPAKLIPAPGQYLVASHASDSPLPVSVYSTESAPDGFFAAPVPDWWSPGMDLHLRGPLGRGFTLPVPARRVALLALDESPGRLLGLIAPALKQGAAVVLVTDSDADSLADDVEVHPTSALGEAAGWADYLAFDLARDSLPGWRERLGSMKQAWAGKDAQILVHTPVPCGGVADCGVCAVTLKSGWALACKDGPVFALGEVLGG